MISVQIFIFKVSSFTINDLKKRQSKIKQKTSIKTPEISADSPLGWLHSKVASTMHLSKSDHPNYDLRINHKNSKKAIAFQLPASPAFYFSIHVHMLWST